MNIKSILAMSITILGSCISCTSTKQNNIKEQIICPMHYDPICAKIKVDGKIIRKTFSNSCTLGNAQNEVIDSDDGECEK